MRLSISFSLQFVLFETKLQTLCDLKWVRSHILCSTCSLVFFLLPFTKQVIQL